MIIHNIQAFIRKLSTNLKGGAAMSEAPAGPTENPSTPPPPPPPPECGVRFSMFHVLVWVTTVNFVLIFGGTIYSSITVESIRKSYQEAESRINDAKGEYLKASSDLEKQKAQVAGAAAEIESLSKNVDRFAGRLSDLQRESEARVRAITEDARAQLNSLKAERAAIGSTLRALEDDLKQTIRHNSNTIRGEVDKHIQNAGKMVRESDTQLRTLEPAILELNARIETKKQELETLQQTANRTLDDVRNENKKLRMELAKLRDSRVIGANTVWRHSDLTLRTSLVIVGLLALTAFLISATPLVLRVLRRPPLQRSP